MINVDWIGFCIASVAAVLSPGPGSFFVAKAASSGARDGFMAMLGIMAGDLCLVSLSFIGVSAIFLAHPSLFHIVRFVGAGYLIFLGLPMVLAQPKEQLNGSHANGRSFQQAVAITLFNPYAVLFFMAFFPIFIRSSENNLLAIYAAMTVILMMISATYLSFIVCVSSKVASVFQQNLRLQLVARKICGCVFIVFGLKVALLSR